MGWGYLQFQSRADGKGVELIGTRGGASEYLNWADLIYVTDLDCWTWSFQIHSSNICASSLQSSSCSVRVTDFLSLNLVFVGTSFKKILFIQGDSGSPLVDEFSVQQGITSFGRMGCPINTPGAYTQVSYYLDWIREEIAKSTKQQSTPRNCCS